MLTLPPPNNTTYTCISTPYSPDKAVPNCPTFCLSDIYLLVRIEYRMTATSTRGSTSTLRRLMRQEEESRSCESSTKSAKKRDRGHDCDEERRIHNPIWRKMVVEWCYQVIDHISADRELVYITMNILDRFLAAHHKNRTNASTYQYLTDKKAYETAVMTSLLVTMKLQGISALCVSDLVKMSSNRVSSTDIIEVGKEIVRTLTWNTQIPTAARFAHAFVDLMPESIANHTKMSVFENAVYQIELSIQDEGCSRKPPSLVAWMAFENAISNTCIHNLLKISICSQISEEMESKYSFSLRARLQSFQEYGHVPSNMPEIIPPDEDEESLSSEGPSALSLKSRPLSDSHVVSMEDISKMPSFPQPKKFKSKTTVDSHNNGYTLRRTKRNRFF